MTTCSDCAGTGGGHPDNVGYRCSKCGGSGGVLNATDDEIATCGITVVAAKGVLYCSKCQADKEERDDMDYQQYLSTVSA